jgi:hypothetical protein
VNAYDDANPLNNIIRMHQRYKREQQKQKEADREKLRLAKLK